MSALNLFIWLGYFLRTLEAGCVKRKPRTRTEIVSSDVPCAFIYVMLLNSLILLFRSFPPRTQWLQEDLSLRQKWMGKSFFLKKTLLSMERKCTPKTSSLTNRASKTIIQTSLPCNIYSQLQSLKLSHAAKPSRA